MGPGKTWHEIAKTVSWQWQDYSIDRFDWLRVGGWYSSAGDKKNAAVLTDDTLAHSLKKMIEIDLIILPVIDESQQIIGSITLTEILNLALNDS